MKTLSDMAATNSDNYEQESCVIFVKKFLILEEIKNWCLNSEAKNSQKRNEISQKENKILC